MPRVKHGGCTLSQRLTGDVQLPVHELRLQKATGIAAQEQVISGEFNVPLLSGDEARRVLRCWIGEANGEACD
jgi:hypothetical protein